MRPRCGLWHFLLWSLPVLQVIVQHALIEEKLRKHLRKSAFVSDEQRKLMRDKELTGASPCLAVCRILIATFQRLMNKPHSHKTKKSLVEPSPRAPGVGGGSLYAAEPRILSGLAAFVSPGKRTIRCLFHLKFRKS